MSKNVNYQSKKNHSASASGNGDRIARNPVAVVTCILILVGALVFVGVMIANHRGGGEGDPSGTGSTYDYDYDTVLPREDFQDDPLKYLSVPDDLKSIIVRNADLEALYQTLVDEIRLASASYSESGSPDDRAELYDRLTVSYVGTPVGVEVSQELLAALSVGNEVLIPGSDDLIPAFENPSDPEQSTKSFAEQLIGCAVGETRVIVVTFPEDESSSEVDVTPILGKRVSFEITLTKLEKATIPELTDSLVNKYTAGAQTTVAELQEAVYESNRCYLAYDAICDAIKVTSYPGELLDQEIVAYLDGVLSSEYEDPDSLSDEELMELTNQLYDEAYAYAMESVGNRLKLEYLLVLTGVTLTKGEYVTCLEEDYQSAYMTYYVYYGIESVADLETAFGRDNLILKYSYFKLLDLVPGLVTFE